MNIVLAGAHTHGALLLFASSDAHAHDGGISWTHYACMYVRSCSLVYMHARDTHDRACEVWCAIQRRTHITHTRTHALRSFPCRTRTFSIRWLVDFTPAAAATAVAAKCMGRGWLVCADGRRVRNVYGRNRCVTCVEPEGFWSGRCWWEGGGKGA